MGPKASDVMRQARELSEDERRELAIELLELAIAPEVHAAWIDEVRKRLHDVDSGEVEYCSGDARRRFSDAPTVFPVLLDLPAPKLRAYVRETVIAEQLHAIVDLGMANSRLKDYFDLGYLAEHFEFDAQRLSSAITATFNARGSTFPQKCRSV